MDEYVCENCFDDYAVREFIRREAVEPKCDYCGAESETEAIAAPLSDVAHFISEGIETEWSDPDDEGVPWDSEEGRYMVEVYDTYDLLERLLPISSDELLKDLSHELGDRNWCQRNPARFTRQEVLFFNWESFSEQLKHHTRYVFYRVEHERDEYDELSRTPYDILETLGDLVLDQELLRTLPAGTTIVRARPHREDEAFSVVKDLGPPPEQYAIHPNRMSPAGIPMFYGSDTEETALGEIDQIGFATVADFRTLKEFQVLDLTQIPSIPSFGPLLREQHLQPYHPMPPLVGAERPDGRTERTLAVGLFPAEGRAGHEIVGVNLTNREVTRFERGAPGASMAGPQTCGQPASNQQTAQRYTAGQVWVTVTQGGKVVWKFLVVRPAASSGTRGSGVELRFVDYRGKRVLYRAHVPILNVKYDNDACGPYRDWQYEEGMIQANGAVVAPGFILCPTPATTILDTGSDAGNFLGVGIYVQGQEVVLVSEMEAGWYRYISQWRLHTNGTIRPRFGFSAVNTSSCVCNRHHHHVYWRFDFDIRTPGNNIVREFNDPPIIGNSKWHTKQFEIRRPRDPARKRKWRVENSATGEAYDIVPGPEDGVASTSPDAPYPRGDVWILRYRASELDDGVDCTTGGPGCTTEANLDGFVNGESVNRQDVVIWYAGHVTHDVKTEPPGEFGHICGPDLKLVKW